MHVTMGALQPGDGLKLLQRQTERDRQRERERERERERDRERKRKTATGRDNKGYNNITTGGNQNLNQSLDKRQANYMDYRSCFFQSHGNWKRHPNQVLACAL